MITLYSGTPGSGKSLDLARLLYYRTQNRNRITIGNFYVNVKACGRHQKGYYIQCENINLRPDRLIRFSKNWQRWNHARPKEGQFLLVIDESQIMFNARDWQQSGRADWLSFFTQHRKYGYDIILIAQFDRMIDRQVCSLIEYEIVHRKVKNAGFIGFFVSIFFGGNLFVAVKIWYPMKERVSADWYVGGKKYFRIYDSFAEFSTVSESKARGQGVPLPAPVQSDFP